MEEASLVQSPAGPRPHQRGELGLSQSWCRVRGRQAREGVRDKLSGADSHLLLHL